MKQFFTVLKFELDNYLKKKSFIISTIIIAMVAIVGLSFPTIMDTFKGGDGTKIEKPSDKDQYGIVDSNKIIGGIQLLNEAYPDKNWTLYKDEAALKEDINEEKIKGGIHVTSDNKFAYMVKNKGIGGDNSMIDSFSSILSKIHQKNAITNAGMDYETIDKIYNAEIQASFDVLGTDNSNNYFYAYILIFILYMMILMYGQTIAVAVTSEKSNRAIEVLVTSTSSNSLICGKVIAGAIASLVQIGVIMTSVLVTYNLNSSSWDGKLDFIFKIPTEIIIVFILFGLTGYLLYSFIYAALGALVSKAEEVGQSIGPITIVFIAVFMISMFGLQNGHSLLIRIASYVPLSSPMSILSRVAMGNMAVWQIAISYILLLVTTVLVAIGASKLYRMGTLRYGNPIKLKNAFKMLKHKDN